ncbi:LacI family transcriptional regulator [Halanaerobium saccharolyticum]|uniref:LacI family transcriptional regulator n=1 Tax=Halanaerobium saccharolyticum TaxID=43595 RepID=A0A4R6LQ17_9FIRM|nr:LacI family DNA-binding transcriptional regulator [Halanaerobium saccharolyticum]TDO85900.1 LacI family transcriptional regulator [Halanaerobium saccharolyticum]
MSEITINDIAKEAGVGKSTVSRVINGSGYVSSETRKKIEKVMEENNYFPSAVARSLSKQESDTIGLIIPEANNPFFGEILSGVSQSIDENDLTLILCNTANEIEKDFRSLQVMLRQRSKGLIFTPAGNYNKKQFKKLNNLIEKINCPIVLLDRSIEGFTTDGVYSDNFTSSYLATEALIKAGHSRIGIIQGDLSLSIGRERLAGYKKALEAYGLEINDHYIVPGNFDADTTYNLMIDLLNSEAELPTAFFISNNLSCIGFLRAVFEKNLKIPEDIAFVVFDKVAGQELFNMKYSYVERDVRKMGKKAMELLLKRFEHPDKPYEKVIIDSKLKLLGSELYI